jgi:septum formation protein
MKLILASASPRRAEILRNAGFEFEVRPAHVDETILPNEQAQDYVKRLAETKAKAIAELASQQEGGGYVVGADTVVMIETQIFGKPADADDARRMLRHLSGKSHEVLTGMALLRAADRQVNTNVERTRVEFLPLSEKDIEDYIATAEPFDKAGAYGIQGVGSRFISRIEGCYFNVMGLPVSRLWQMLRPLGWRDDEPPRQK